MWYQWLDEWETGWHCLTNEQVIKVPYAQQTEVDVLERTVMIVNNSYYYWKYLLKSLIFLIIYFQARQINIMNLQPFFDSDIFKCNNFTHDAKRQLIVQTFWVILSVTAVEASGIQAQDAVLNFVAYFQGKNSTKHAFPSLVIPQSGFFSGPINYRGNLLKIGIM